MTASVLAVDQSRISRKPSVRLAQVDPRAVQYGAGPHGKISFAEMVVQLLDVAATPIHGELYKYHSGKRD